MELLVAAALGWVAGLLSGLLPGMHPAPLLVLAAPWLTTLPGAAGGTAFVVANLFTTAWPTTYLSVASPDHPLAVMPAQRLAAGGRGREAVRTLADATLAAVLLATLLILPLKWLAGEPGRWADAPNWLLALFLGAFAVWIVLRERRNGLQGCLRAGFMFLAAGALAWVVLSMPWSPQWGHPADARLPLFTGLFAMPHLLRARRSTQNLPEQQPPSRSLPRFVRGRTAVAIVAGTVAGAWSGLVPGATAGLAAASVRRPTTDPRPGLAGMAAAQAGRQVFALALLWIAAQARSPLAFAVKPLAQPGWSAGAIPSQLSVLVAVVLVVGLASHTIVRLADRRIAVWLVERDLRLLSTVCALALGLACLLLAGPMGLVVLAGATALGLLPAEWEVSGLCLVGAFLVPAFNRLW